MALQRTVGALARWAALSRSRGEDPRRVQLRGSQLFDAVTSEFQRFGWWPGRRWGTFVDRARRSWDISAPKALQLKAAHLLRDVWRLAQVVVWRDSPSRRDSALARSISLQITIPLINKLRSLARKQNGDGLAVMCGGASTNAVWTPAGPIRHVCHLCNRSIVPSVSHIFWKCSFFSHLRVLRPPRCPLSQRLGWGPVRNGLHNLDREQCALISQLSDIRRAEWKARSLNPAWARYRGSARPHEPG